MDTSPVIEKYVLFESEVDQPLGLLPFRYNVCPSLILRYELYCDQLVPSVEYCKSGLLLPRLFNVKIECLLAIMVTYESPFFVQPLGSRKSCAV
jgi:hypothetical protein